jgi:TPR repeat protein
MAAYVLGQWYLGGVHGLPKDETQANIWFYRSADGLRAAATKGDAVAQSHLGFMYARGHGVPQDIPLGTQWFRKAAAQGDAFAKAQLEEYLNGYEAIKKQESAAAQQIAQQKPAPDPNTNAAFTDLNAKLAAITNYPIEISPDGKSFRIAGDFDVPSTPGGV